MNNDDTGKNKYYMKIDLPRDLINVVFLYTINEHDCYSLLTKYRHLYIFKVPTLINTYLPSHGFMQAVADDLHFAGDILCSIYD